MVEQDGVSTPVHMITNQVRKILWTTIPRSLGPAACTTSSYSAEVATLLISPLRSGDDSSTSQHRDPGVYLLVGHRLL